MHRPLPPVRFCLYRDGISRGTGGCEDPDDGQTKPVTENASSFAWSVQYLQRSSSMKRFNISKMKYQIIHITFIPMDKVR